MNRRWLLLPLIALLATPLAWSAAAASFEVSPSVLQTLVVTDLPAIPEDPDDPPPPPPPPPPLDRIVADDCQLATARDDVVCLTVVKFRYSGGSTTVQGSTTVRWSLPVNSTYRLALSGTTQRTCTADASAGGPFARTGVGSGFPATTDVAHRVCDTTNNPGEVVVTLDSLPAAGTTSFATSSATMRSSDTMVAPSEPQRASDSTPGDVDPGTSEASSTRDEPPPGQPTQDAFDLPDDERPAGDHQGEEVAP